MTTNKRYRLGCDIGGTFTDFVLLDDETGELRTHKCLTTPGDPSDAVEQGIRGLQVGVPEFLGQAAEVIHGTTLVINAIIERKGANTGLITTAGFRDVLELGREIRYAPYDIFAEFPRPLVPRRLRREVDERVRADGAVLRPLDEAGARQVIRELVAEGVQSVAICLLNSYADRRHERLVQQIARELGFDDISTSSDVAPLIKIVSRGDTTVVDAYLNPVLRDYVNGLRGTLNQSGRSELRILTSAGGLVDADQFVGKDSILSGPAGGVEGFSHAARAAGFARAIGFDMGGTSTDVSR